MIYQTAILAFLFAFVYWLGCKRTLLKSEMLSLMTPKQYRNFTEIKLYIAKGIILVLLVLLFWVKHHG